MILFHGTGALHDVLTQGFDVEFVGTNFDGESGGLETHGGFYLTSDILVAADYATRSGTSPGVLVVEVDDDQVIADEDALAYVARHCLGLYQNKFDEICRTDPDEVQEMLEEGELYDTVARFANMIDIERNEENLNLCAEYLTRLAETRYDDVTTPEFVDVTERLGHAAPATATEEWSRRLNRHAHSCRVVWSVPEILGWIGVEVKPDGSQITRIFTGGQIEPQDVQEAVDVIHDSLLNACPEMSPVLPEIETGTARPVARQASLKS